MTCIIFHPRSGFYKYSDFDNSTQDTAYNYNIANMRQSQYFKKIFKRINTKGTPDFRRNEHAFCLVI